MKNFYHVDSAYFLNEDKTLISAYVTETNDEGTSADFTRVIEVTPSRLFNEFLEQVSLEKVEENSQRMQQELDADYNKNERALIHKIKSELEGFSGTSSEGSPFDINNVSADDLFKIKLQCFEISEVKDSTNRTLKSKIRKSESFMGVLSYTVALILDSQSE